MSASSPMIAPAATSDRNPPEQNQTQPDVAAECSHRKRRSKMLHQSTASVRFFPLPSGKRPIGHSTVELDRGLLYFAYSPARGKTDGHAPFGSVKPKLHTLANCSTIVKRSSVRLPVNPAKQQQGTSTLTINNPKHIPSGNGGNSFYSSFSFFFFGSVPLY